MSDRREFLKAGGAALAVSAMSARSYGAIIGANDRVRVGVVGCGDRMLGGDIPAFVTSQKAMNFELVAVSDIWKLAREKGAAKIEKMAGCSKLDLVRNNDELYARKDIDAVIIATADFQHARHGIEAVKAGRDAYVEKPTAHFMDDARDFREAVHESGKIVQVGTQRRSTPSYMKAAEYIKSGQVWRHCDGGDELECEPAGTVAAAGCGSAAEGRGYGLEAVLHGADQGSVRCAEVS